MTPKRHFEINWPLQRRSGKLRLSYHASKPINVTLNHLVYSVSEIISTDWSLLSSYQTKASVHITNQKRVFHNRNTFCHILVILYSCFGFRQVYSTKTFIIPVILFSILYNVSKFFELQCVKSLVLQNNTMVAGKELGGLHVF